MAKTLMPPASITRNLNFLTTNMKDSTETSKHNMFTVISWYVGSGTSGYIMKS